MRPKYEGASSQQPRFFVRESAANTRSLVHPASLPPVGMFDEKITSTYRFIKRLPGTKKNVFFEKVAQQNLLDNNGIFAPKAPYLKADFAEGEILLQQFPARELRAHLLRGSSLVIIFYRRLLINLCNLHAAADLSKH